MLVTVLPPVLETLNEKFIVVPEVEFTVSDGPPGVVVREISDVFPEAWDVPLALTALTLNA